MLLPIFCKIGETVSNISFWKRQMTSFGLRHSWKQMKWTVQNLCTLLFQMILLMVIKHQTTSPLTCQDFPMVSMLSKWHAPRPNRFQWPASVFAIQFSRTSNRKVNSSLYGQRNQVAPCPTMSWKLNSSAFAGKTPLSKRGRPQASARRSAKREQSRSMAWDAFPWPCTKNSGWSCWICLTIFARSSPRTKRSWSQRTSFGSHCVSGKSNVGSVPFLGAFWRLHREVIGVSGTAARIMPFLAR